MMFALPDPGLVEICGRDAIGFANAQFCNDVTSLATGTWQYNAWLTPQGRVHALFALLRPAPEQLLLCLRGGDANTLATELLRFRFRSKVEISALSGWRASGLTGTPAIEHHGARALLAQTDAPRRLFQAADEIGFLASIDAPRLHLLRRPSPDAAAATDVDALRAWQDADIRAGLVWLDAATQDAFLPQALGLESLPALSFNKGCYPGQEIVARLHFKGGNKRHLYRVEFPARRLPPAGSAIASRDVADAASADAGMLLQGCALDEDRAHGLAVLRDDALDRALQVDGAGALVLGQRF